jgi:hypothetical protein
MLTTRIRGKYLPLPTPLGSEPVTIEKMVTTRIRKLFPYQHR